MPQPEPFEPAGLRAARSWPTCRRSRARSARSGASASSSTSPTSRRATTWRGSRRDALVSLRSRRGATASRCRFRTRSSRGENAGGAVPDPLARRGRPATRAGVDTYWVSAAEHGLNASTFTARIARLDRRRLRRGDLVGGRRALRPAARRCADPRPSSHARRGRRPCGDAGDVRVADMLDRGERIMGFGHRVYRAEDPRARVLRRTARELGSPRVEVAEAARGGGARGAAREVARPRARDERRVLGSALVLDVAEIPPPLVPADVRLRARRGLVGAHPRAAPHRPPDPPVRSLRRAAEHGRSKRFRDPAVAGRGCRRGDAFAERGPERDARRPPARVGATSSRRPRGAPTIASAPSPTARSVSSASGRRSSCCAAASRTRARPAVARRCSRSSCSHATILAP